MPKRPRRPSLCALDRVRRAPAGPALTGLAALALCVVSARPAARAQTATITAPVPAIDNRERDAVLGAYQRLYVPAGAVPSGFTGNVAAGVAGSLSDDFQRATLSRINLARALAGLNGDVVLDPALSAKCQLAALMEAVHGSLSHFPDPTWRFYSAEGAEAASHSNLFLGVVGPAAVEGYLADVGDNNAIVGHRHWLLLAGQTTMGSGSVGGAGYAPGLLYGGQANATWVVPTTPGVPARPAGTPARVAWPSAGFFPAPLVPARWSVWENDIDFSGAAVRVSRDGVDLGPVSTLAAERVWYWEDALVFTPVLPPGAPSRLRDETYRVQVSGARRASTGAAVGYDYTVVTANPGTAGNPTPAPAVLPVVSVNGDAGRGGFILARTGDSSAALDVTYHVGGGAVAGVDYRLLPGFATFPAGSDALLIPVVRLTGHSKVKLFLDPGAYSFGKAQSKLFLSDL